MCCGDILLIQCIAMGGDLYSDGHWTVIVPGISGRLWRWLEMIRKKDARALGRWLFPSLCSDHFSRKTVVISQCVRGSICTRRTITSLLANWPKKGEVSSHSLAVSGALQVPMCLYQWQLFFLQFSFSLMLSTSLIQVGATHAMHPTHPNHPFHATSKQIQKTNKQYSLGFDVFQI